MLFQLLEKQGRDRSEQAALIHGGTSVSWSQLLERSTRLSGGLSGLGVGPDDVVGLLLPNSPEFVTALLALARLGSQVIPLHPDLRAPELRLAIAAAGCTMLIAADAMADFCRDFGPRVVQVTAEEFGLPSLTRMSVDGVATGAPPIDTKSPFLHLLTSGTTGRPNRIIRTQTALRALAEACRETLFLTSRDRILYVSPLQHGQGICMGVLAPLCSGATLFLEGGFERRRALRMLSEEQVTFFPAAPFIYTVLAETRTDLAPRFPALRIPLSSGAPLRTDDWYKVRDQLGIRLRQYYGASEAGAMAINMDENPDVGKESVGRPIAGVQISVSEESGRLKVLSPGAATWAAPLESGKPLTPLADADGWIHLSDTGRFDSDGRLFITGRTSRFINIAGRKVNPLEVEEVLASHPSVAKATVFAVDPGQSNESAKAIVYCSAACSAAELTGLCRERLAEYKIPRVIELRSNAERLK